jgi:hypothetical protein
VKKPTHAKDDTRLPRSHELQNQEVPDIEPMRPLFEPSKYIKYPIEKLKEAGFEDHDIADYMNGKYQADLAAWATRHKEWRQRHPNWKDLTRYPDLKMSDSIPPSSTTPVPVQVVPPHQLPPRRINRKLPNGTIIRSFSLHGRGELTIKNGLSLDAAAKLIDKQEDKCKVYFYICAYGQFTLSGINHGDYRLLFGIGADWDQATELFTRDQAFSEFNKPMTFVTSQEQHGDSIYENYKVMEVTLHPVPGGNIKTHTISAKEFQKY